MTPTIETKQLLLTPLQLSDAEQTQSLFPHWEIVRFLNASVPWPYPNDGAFTYYRDVSLPAVERGVEWHWTLRLRESPEMLIGAILLTDKADDHRGFWLGLPWQRRGLMTEAVVATTDFWFETLGRSVLRTRKAAENIASRQLSQRAGMRRIAVEPHQFVAGELPSEVWEITREEWREHKIKADLRGHVNVRSVLVPMTVRASNKLSL